MAVEMLHQSESTTTSKAFGRAIKSYDLGFDEIPYDFEWDEFKSADDIREVNAWPSDAEILKMVNASEKNKARTNAMNAAIKAAGITKPNEENDPQVRLQNMEKTLKSNTVNGVRTFTDQQAHDMASQILGIPWADK